MEIPKIDPEQSLKHNLDFEVQKCNSVCNPDGVDDLDIKRKITKLRNGQIVKL